MLRMSFFVIRLWYTRCVSVVKQIGTGNSPSNLPHRDFWLFAKYSDAAIPIVLRVQTESSFRLFSGSRGTDDGSDVEVFHLIHPLGSFAPDASSPATARIICSTTSELSLCSRCSSSLSDSRGLSLFLRKEDELTTVHGAAQLPSDAMPLRRVEVHLPGHDVV